jgi:hypothetical protein
MGGHQDFFFSAKVFQNFDENRLPLILNKTFWYSYNFLNGCIYKFVYQILGGIFKNKSRTVFPETGFTGAKQ